MSRRGRLRHILIDKKYTLDIRIGPNLNLEP
jgi:hypothetical protein